MNDVVVLPGAALFRASRVISAEPDRSNPKNLRVTLEGHVHPLVLPDTTLEELQVALKKAAANA